MALWHALMHKAYAYSATHAEVGADGPDGTLVDLMAGEVIAEYREREVQGDADDFRAQPGDGIWMADAYQLWKQNGEEPAFKEY